MGVHNEDNKFVISTENKISVDPFELLDNSYSRLYIQDYIKYIIKT